MGTFAMMVLAAAAFVCVALLLGGRFLYDRWQRWAFIEGLLPAEVEHLRAFESFKGNWHDFKDLRQTLAHNPRD